MEDINELTEANLNLTLPVKIGYGVLDEFMKQKLVGEIISKDGSEDQGSNYAQILDVNLSKSEKENFELSLELELQSLTTLFKNRHIQIVFDFNLELDRQEQRIYLSDYTADGRTNSWIANQLIETVINRLLHAKLKKKLNVDLMPHIDKHLNELNEKLENEMEARQGIHILGGVERLEISSMKFGEKDLWIGLLIQGSGLVEVREIKLS